MDVLFIINWLALLLSFFVAGCVLGVAFSKPFRQAVVETVKRITGVELSRTLLNPIIRPNQHPWQAEAVFNPAAAIINDRTHLIYRAIGTDGLSRLGYASSPDGITFDERLPYPVYVSSNPSGHGAPTGPLRRYSPVMYPSGGSWGGYEDPRMVAIDGRVYVTFNLFENWALRVGYISMSEEDFLAKRFYKWEGPVVLSHGSRDKNWVLFPEKINGQFAVLHSIIGDTPDRVRIEYTDNLKTLRSRQFVSPDPQQVPDQPIVWHVHVRSAGPPPLKTSRGWLLFYHANDAKEWQRYKIGAMLLDLNDPTKIIARAHTPVLEPDFEYENAGKPGIVYACGATIQDGHVYLYYGGADKVICVASAHLKRFIDALIKDKDADLSPAPLQAP
ncbi:MAG: hypothetical protein Q7R54_02315 [bacterium]|nr:hypothetical protein [bacterium]